MAELKDLPGNQREEFTQQSKEQKPEGGMAKMSGNVKKETSHETEDKLVVEGEKKQMLVVEMVAFVPFTPILERRGLL